MPITKRLDASRITTRLIPVDAIEDHPQNYNMHPDEQIAQLAQSHATFGQYRSILVWERPGGKYIRVVGHGYSAGAKQEGEPLLRCEVLPIDTDPETVKAIMLADNLHAQNSQPDDTLLAHLLQEQSDAGFDLASLGSDEETLRQMLESLGDAYVGDGERDESEDELPEEVETRAKLGDIWQLGRHTVACMDSCDPETYKKLFESVKPAMVFADPPYGINIVATNGYVGGGEAYDIPFGGVKNRAKGTIGASKVFGSIGSKDRDDRVRKANKYAPVIGDDTTRTAIAAYLLCAESFPDATHVWWGANYYSHVFPPSKCWIVWDKENTGNFADAELAWCSDDSAIRIFKHMWNGMIKASEFKEVRIHPTQKPIKLAEWCYEKYGKEHDIIYDPFLGSGMSLIAAENTNRTVIGCELSPEYIDIIIARWEKISGQTATFLQRTSEVSHA